MAEGNGTQQGALWTVPPEKFCPKCKTWKPLDDFGKVKGRYRSYCRTCHTSSVNTPDIRTEKRCALCKLVKPVSEFNKCGMRYQPYCRPCNRDVSREHKEQYKASGKAEVYWRGYYENVKRWASIKRKYGIEREDYEELLGKQDGKCAICRQPETDIYRGVPLWLSVDHDHKTGIVRGLLCRACNVGLAKFSDNIEAIERAIDYLKSSQRSG